MSTEPISATATSAPPAPWPVVRSPELRGSVGLHSGDRMSRKEFHRLYEQTPEDFKAELIGGIVYVASPLHPAHGKPHLLLNAVVAAYQGNTPGTEASDNTTVFLSDEGEPQPDIYLRILPEYGGQSANSDDDYVDGAPELIIEVAHSSRAIDLHAKKADYARYGVREYVVACVQEQTLRWFDLKAGTELQPDDQQICRVRIFPGLWINGSALWKQNYTDLMQTVEAGLATAEHAAFVKDLAGRKKTAK